MNSSINYFHFTNFVREKIIRRAWHIGTCRYTSYISVPNLGTTIFIYPVHLCLYNCYKRSTLIMIRTRLFIIWIYYLICSILTRRRILLSQNIIYCVQRVRILYTSNYHPREFLFSSLRLCLKIKHWQFNYCLKRVRRYGFYFCEIVVRRIYNIWLIIDIMGEPEFVRI